MLIEPDRLKCESKGMDLVQDIEARQSDWNAFMKSIHCQGIRLISHALSEMRLIADMSGRAIARISGAAVAKAVSRF